MSNLVRARINRQFMDTECIEKAIQELGWSLYKVGNTYTLCDGFILIQTDNGFKLIYNEANEKHRNFVNKFPEVYDRQVQDKIERLRREELELMKMDEDRVLSVFASEEEKKAREIQLRRERMALEQKKKEEKIAIQKKGDAILEKAKKLGYEVRTENKNGERILVCVRRK